MLWLDPAANEPKGVLGKRVSQDADLLRTNADFLAADVSPAVVVLPALLAQTLRTDNTYQSKRSISDRIHIVKFHVA
mgnify:CR=1 FL=1